MTLGRRLRVYGIGLLLGVILSYLFLGDRLTTTAWMPKDRVKDRLYSTLVKTTPSAERALITKGITIDEVRGTMLTSEIVLSDTERGVDSIFYHVKSKVKGQSLDMIIAGIKDFDRDSTATLVNVR